MNWQALWREQQDELEDFWGRRQTQPRFRREFAIFGHPVWLLSNDAQVCAAVDHSLPLFSVAPTRVAEPWTVQIAVQAARIAPGPPPSDLMNQNWYTGDGNWVMMQVGAWGHAYADLAQGRAVVVLTPELAQRPELVSHALLNTILLNFCLGNGYGMLHASCLLRDGRVLLLLAPHNTGKSTTALHLILGGYRLVTDSMIHIVPDNERLLFVGFPTGRIKLRRDMVRRFPQLQPLLAAEQVRDETKYMLDLRRLAGEWVVETAVSPTQIELCLLQRHDSPQTMLTPATETAVWSAIMQNSLFYDTLTIWERNLAQIARVVRRARAHYLTIGHDPADIVAVVDQLWKT